MSKNLVKTIAVILLQFIMLSVVLNPTNAGVTYSCPSASPSYTLSGVQCQRYISATGFPKSTGGSQPKDIFVDANGYIYTSNYGSNTVSKLDQNGNQFPGSPFPTGGVNPEGIYVDTNGFIYATNYSSNTVTKLNPNGTQVSGSPFAIGGNGPVSVWVDSTGYIYTANYNSNNISKLDPNGAAVAGSPFTVGTNPSGIFVDQSGFIYTANWGSNDITKLNSNGSQVTGSPFPVGGVNPRDIYVDSAGNMFTTNWTSNNVSKIQATGLPAPGSPFLAGSNPSRLFVSQGGNIAVANWSSNTVNLFSPNFSNIQGFPVIAGTKPEATFIDNTGNVYVVNRDSADIYKFTNETIQANANFTAESGLQNISFVLNSQTMVEGKTYSFALSNITYDGVNPIPASSNFTCKVIINEKTYSGFINTVNGQCSFEDVSFTVPIGQNSLNALISAGSESRIFTYTIQKDPTLNQTNNNSNGDVSVSDELPVQNNNNGGGSTGVDLLSFLLLYLGTLVLGVGGFVIYKVSKSKPHNYEHQTAEDLIGKIDDETVSVA